MPMVSSVIFVISNACPRGLLAALYPFRPLAKVAVDLTPLRPSKTTRHQTTTGPQGLGLRNLYVLERQLAFIFRLLLAGFAIDHLVQFLDKTLRPCVQRLKSTDLRCEGRILFTNRQDGGLHIRRKGV